MEETDLIPGFCFVVNFFGLAEQQDKTDTGFQSISGIAAVLSAKAENNKKLTTTYSPVILKRAMVDPKASPLSLWIFQCLKNPEYKPLEKVLITMTNQAASFSIVICLRNVFLAGWTMGELNAQKNELLIEEIALSYEAIECN